MTKRRCQSSKERWRGDLGTKLSCAGSTSSIARASVTRDSSPSPPNSSAAMALRPGVRGGGGALGGGRDTSLARVTRLLARTGGGEAGGGDETGGGGVGDGEGASSPSAAADGASGAACRYGG